MTTTGVTDVQVEPTVIGPSTFRSLTLLNVGAVPVFIGPRDPTAMLFVIRPGDPPYFHASPSGSEPLYAIGADLGLTGAQQALGRIRWIAE